MTKAAQVLWTYFYLNKSLCPFDHIFILWLQECTSKFIIRKHRKHRNAHSHYPKPYKHTSVLFLYSCRLLTGHCAQDIDDSVLLMNNHLSKGAPQETLCQPDDPWITNEKDIKPYILKHLNNIKLSTSQYIATSIINYGPYMDNLITLEHFTHTLHRQLINAINSKLPIGTNKENIINS